MRDDSRIRHLVNLFGSATELARVAGVDKAAVHRWPPKRGIAADHKSKILHAGMLRGAAADELLWALDVKRCPCCGTVVERDLQQVLEAASA